MKKKAVLISFIICFLIFNNSYGKIEVLRNFLLLKGEV